MTTTDEVTRELRSILRVRTKGVRDRWRAWSDDLMSPGRLSPALLAAIWAEILDYDSALSDYIASPVPLPDRAVIVAGSGKETFKTFNVSTAASVLAASSGIPIVKGVSHSVSAVSGAADVLDALGIAPVEHPAEVTAAIRTDGIAFVSYAAFCPTYAGRYDGVFPVLSPFSFFMPVAVLAVDVSRFLFGVAHRDVRLAAATIHTVRPTLRTGVAVATEIGAHEVMDEWIDLGTAHAARVGEYGIDLSIQTHDQPAAAWRSAVHHRTRHAENAHAVADALSPTGHPARTSLVEHNAALAVRVAQDDQIALPDALDVVRSARRDGRAQRLLAHLQQRREGLPRPCTAS